MIALSFWMDVAPWIILVCGLFVAAVVLLVVLVVVLSWFFERAENRQCEDRLWPSHLPSRRPGFWL